MKPWMSFLLNSLIFFVIVLVLRSVMYRQIMWEGALMATAVYTVLNALLKILARPRKKK